MVSMVQLAISRRNMVLLSLIIFMWWVLFIQHESIKVIALSLNTIV